MTLVQARLNEERWAENDAPEDEQQWEEPASPASPVRRAEPEEVYEDTNVVKKPSYEPEDTYGEAQSAESYEPEATYQEADNVVAASSPVRQTPQSNAR